MNPSDGLLILKNWITRSSLAYSSDDKAETYPGSVASEHIVGYTIFNDWSARDVQEDIMSLRMGPAKS